VRIFLSVHNDDSELFGCAIIQRMKPLLLAVVTDSFIQERRGDGITWQQRRAESAAAAQLMDVPICFLGIPDAELSRDNLMDALKIFHRNDEVIAPALQGGNPQHDIVAAVAQEYFRVVWQYATYAKGQCFTPIPGTPIHLSEKEAALKDRALDCHQSQIQLASTRPHFDAMRGPSTLSGWPPEYIDLSARSDRVLMPDEHGALPWN
jgi:LmbE family N-acetylglucosaminyl deacetylase